MNSPTVQTVYDILNDFAPFDTAESFDNVGLLVGSAAARIERILVALDATPDVVEEAIEKGVQLIVTHHPLMFRGTKHILLEDYEGGLITKLLRSGINLIAAHTNLDQSESFSGSAVLSDMLGLCDVHCEGYVFVGSLPEPMTAEQLRRHISKTEEDAVYLFGDPLRTIKKLAISGGAYDEGYQQAHRMGADAFLTGEVRHHNALSAMGEGYILYQGGHFGTEAVLVPRLAKALQNALNALKYTVVVYPSSRLPYRGKTE